MDWVWMTGGILPGLHQLHFLCYRAYFDVSRLPFDCFLFGFASGSLQISVHLSNDNETLFLPIDFLFSFYNCCHKT